MEGETVIREHTRKKKAAHEELFKGLKVEKVVVPLPEEDQICPVCGMQMVLIGEEYVRRELEFIPAMILCQEKVQIKNDFFPSCQHT